MDGKGDPMLKFRHPNRRGVSGPRPKNSGSGFVGGLPLAEPPVSLPPAVQEAEVEVDLSRVERFSAWSDGRFQVWYREQ